MFGEAVEVAIHYAVARCGRPELSTEPGSLNSSVAMSARTFLQGIANSGKKATSAIGAWMSHFAPYGLSVLPCFHSRSAAVTVDQNALELKARATGQLLQIRHILEDQIRVCVDNDK